MSAPQRRTLKRAAKESKPAVQLTPKAKKAFLLAGDNQAEAAVSVVKRSLRRANKLGRRAPKTTHIDSLACFRLQQQPGLQTVLSALRDYRAARAGCLGCAPQAYAQYDQDKAWLR